jgi:hypothetical protein
VHKQRSVTAAERTNKSKSKVCNDRRSVGQSILVSSPILGPRPEFCYCQTIAGLLMWSALSDERTGQPFTISAGGRQRSHSRVRVQLAHDHIYCLRFKTPPTWRNMPQYLSPKDQVIPPGTGFPFHSLLRLAGLQWMYSNPPPHGS